jgi:hypothetical protein
MASVTYNKEVASARAPIGPQSTRSTSTSRRGVPGQALWRH